MEDRPLFAARPGSGLLACALALTVSLTGSSGQARPWTAPGGEVCRLIPTRTPTDVPPTRAAGTSPCPGVRPGALVLTSDSACTFNFLFKGSDGARYMGTAGHCVLGDGPLATDAGEKVYKSGTGPIAYDASGRRIGRFVYAILQEPKDFGLIRLDSGVTASASVCWFGGPTGTSTSTAAPMVIHYYGNGIGVGDAVPARTAVATYAANPDHLYAQGTVVPGDSGAGVIDSKGKAVGLVVTTGLHIGSLTDIGLVGITRLRPQELRAESKLRIALTLQTAALAG